MTAKRPTITDVAASAGVSKATVSAVLNDSDTVKDATRDRVLTAIELLNYRPTQLGGRAAARRDRSIGVLIKEYDNPYYAEVIAGARAVADARGYTLLVVSSEGEYAAEHKAVALLRGKDVDGLIATPVLDEHADLSHFFELKRRNVPFVLLEEVRGVRASIVDVDNVEASRRAVEHLFALGHTRVVHFAGPAYSAHSEERVDGVHRAFSSSHLAFTDDVIVRAGAHLADGHKAGLALFRRKGGAGVGAAPDTPTGVTCYNDLVAIGLCRALRELGRRVPEDVSVVGYDDVPLCDYLPVPLTSMHVPKYEMGERAAEMLVRQIESKQPPAHEKVYLDAALVVRGSTGPPPAAAPPSAAPSGALPRARRGSAARA
jgi:LacI family transcriptional regulator, galactose operon repressor